MKKKKRMKFFWEEPFERTEKIFKTFEEPFEFRFTFPKITVPTRTIPISMSETERDVVIKADMPGFKKNEINLNVTENFIEINAAKKEEKIEKTKKTYYHERTAGAVSRAFTLPAKVDPDRTKAKLEDGVLTITMPKLEPGVRKKKIEIK